MGNARETLARLKRGADRICVLILSTDLPEVDILIERERLRRLCAQLFPDREDLFEMVYESRFDRLWEQFRDDRLGGQDAWRRSSGET